MKKLLEKKTKADICVVGGGLSGMCAAISAARHGAKVILMHDRPVLGGNSSSEIRMQISGALGPNNLETGIIEEIKLGNLCRNPLRNFSIWDSVLYGKIRFEDNITLLLNCSCNDLVIKEDRIISVKGWQLTTQTWHTVEASIFVDSSGDSILAPLSGAEFRMGREASSKFNEDISLKKGDQKTMGMSLLIQARENLGTQDFISPVWANKYLSCNELPYRNHDPKDIHNNFWWIELGGERNTIHDTEEIRDELLKVAFGVWDHIKNQDNHGADNWALDWVGFLPGKRESRRYVGDYILTANDIRAGGKFKDIVAYGGWPMDDHHPSGINYNGEPTIFHRVPSPYGIPYRCLYSCNINNLFFAGRNISVTHAALSSIRVMGTCAIIGQAVGTAAAICIRNNISPRGVYEKRIDELQQTLMDDDCYLSWNVRELPDLTKKAYLKASKGNPEPLRNGIDRPIQDMDNGWYCKIGSWVEYSFDSPMQINQLRFVFDSNLMREHITRDNLVSNKFDEDLVLNSPCNYPLKSSSAGIPDTLIKSFRVEVFDEDKEWKTVFREKNNYQRLVRVKLDFCVKAIRFIPEETWGTEMVHLFAWDISG